MQRFCNVDFHAKTRFFRTVESLPWRVPAVVGTRAQVLPLELYLLGRVLCLRGPARFVQAGPHRGRHRDGRLRDDTVMGVCDHTVAGDTMGVATDQPTHTRIKNTRFYRARAQKTK